MKTYFLLVVFWILFYAVHSIMASSKVKKFINSLTPMLKSYYRLIFNLVSSLLLLPIGFVYFRLPAEKIFESTIIHQVVGAILTIFGVFVLFDGFKNYRTDEFIGTYQIRNHHDFHPSKLSRTGWNGIVRHPLYFGGILIVIGLFLITPTIKLGITGLLTLGYLYIGSLWEEAKLTAEFGTTYHNYKREVSMLIPIKWIINRMR